MAAKVDHSYVLEAYPNSESTVEEISVSVSPVVVNPHKLKNMFDAGSELQVMTDRGCGQIIG